MKKAVRKERFFNYDEIVSIEKNKKKFIDRNKTMLYFYSILILFSLFFRPVQQRR